MDSTPEKLTPRQRRFILGAFLLFLLIFASIVVGVYWKGQQAQEAKERARCSIGTLQS